MEKQHQSEPGKKKITLSGILGNISGFLFIISALGIMGGGNLFGGLMILGMALLIFPPFMSKLQHSLNMEFSKALRAFGVIACFVTFAMSQSDKDVRKVVGKDRSYAQEKAQARVDSETTKPQAVEEEKESYIGETCRQVSDLFDTESQLTDLQKDEIWEQNYKGKKFEWNLQLVEVSKAVFGSGYVAQFKCTNSRSFIQDVQVQFPEEEKAYVISLQTDQVYKIKGTFKRQSTLTGLSAEADLSTRSPASN